MNFFEQRSDQVVVITNYAIEYQLDPNIKLHLQCCADLIFAFFGREEILL
jgi:hypothetical protein